MSILYCRIYHLIDSINIIFSLLFFWLKCFFNILIILRSYLNSHLFPNFAKMFI